VSATDDTQIATLTVTIEGAPAPADQDPATGRYVVAAIDSTAYPEGASLALVATAVDNRDNVATSTIHVNVNNSDAGLVTATVVKGRVDGATVTAYRFTGGVAGAALGTTMTNANGQYTLVMAEG
jgi:hypothetical protein